MNFLANVQKKPYAERVKLLWLSLLGCLCILIILWITLEAITPKRPNGDSLLPALSDQIKESQDYWKTRFNPKTPDLIH